MGVAAPLPLNRTRILTCAVQIADRDGLDATSLRRVAAELGVHVTSLYNHVPTKEALLDGVAEELFAHADLPTGTLPWKEWVRRFVDGVAGIAREHPGAFAVLLRRPVQGPGAAETFEAGLEAFHRVGLDHGASYAAVKSVALGILGCCVEQSYAALGADELRTDITQLSWQQFPMLHDVAALGDDVDVVAALREVLVAGLASTITTR